MSNVKQRKSRAASLALEAGKKSIKSVSVKFLGDFAVFRTLFPVNNRDGFCEKKKKKKKNTVQDKPVDQDLTIRPLSK